jgi:UDP-3-O-[3-hydroxymyristoyl] glucosamine N-acyltransferase
MTINSTFIKQHIPDCIFNDQELSFDHLGLVYSEVANTLTFLDDYKYLEKGLENPNITGFFILDSFKDVIKRPDIKVIISKDPRYDFYYLMNKVAELSYQKTPSQIAASARIHSSAHVAECNVVIGENVFIEPNVTILSDVEIGAGTIIRSGAVIGSEGFEHKRTSKGILSVWHDGKVLIGKNVEIGANTCIDKGFASRSTIIGDDTKIDNLVHIAHGVQTGKGCFIIACSMIAGSVTLMDNVWVGPNANIAPQVVIEDRGFVSLGSVVTRNVGVEQHVTGNFALPHSKFLEILKKSLNP